MTIGQRRELKSVAVRKSSSMISEKEKAKMHEAGQRQLCQISDVEGDLHKNHQQTASRIHRAAERKRSSLWAKTQDQPQIRRVRSDEVVPEKAFVNVEKPYDNELVNEGENADTGLGHLLILANSAELLESEGNFHHSQSNVLGQKGQCDSEKPMDMKQGNGDVGTEESALRVRGNIRLTQIKHKARLENPQRIQETHVSNRNENADLRKSQDTNYGKRMDADQIQMEIADHLSWPTDTYRGKRVNADQVQRATVEQDLQDGKLLALSLQERHCAASNYYIGRSSSLVMTPEALNDPDNGARERRMLRITERRKQRFEAQFQGMGNAQTWQMLGTHHWWWHAINFQNQQSHVAQQQWSLYMEREGKRIAAQQRRAQRIDEQRASRNMRQLKNSHLMKENHSEEGPHDPNTVIDQENGFVSVKVNQRFQETTTAKSCEDQCGNLQQQTTSADNRGTVRSVERQVRLTQLKHEARQKNSLAEMNNVKKLDCQRNEDQQEKLQCQTSNVETCRKTSSVGQIRLTQLKRKARTKDSPLEMNNSKKLGFQGNKEEGSRS